MSKVTRYNATLDDKEEAVRKALIEIMFKHDKSNQKYDIFGLWCGSWNIDREGTVVKLEKTIDSRSKTIWYNIHKFVSVDEYENYYDINKPKEFGSVISSAGTNNIDRVAKYFIPFIDFGDMAEVELEINRRIAYEEYEKIFNELFNDWSGQCNNNTYREVVAMIGSTKFQKSFLEKCWELSALGYVVTLPNFRPDSMMEEEFDIPEDTLEDIGFKRIEMANRVYVVNEGGYIGSSTKKEIAYANKLNKSIKYMEEIQ